MLATLVDAAHFGDEDGWAFEMKWDGVRAIAYLAGGRVKLLSRKGRDDTTAYFDVADELSTINVETAILDGEVVVTDATGRPSFGLLQHRINLTRPADIERAAKAYPAQLMLFDILAAERSVVDQEAVSRSAGRSWRTWYLPGLDLGSRYRRSSTAIYRPRVTLLINFDSRVW